MARALDGDPDFLHAGQRRKLGHAYLDPRRVEFLEHNLRRRFGKALEELVTMIVRNAFSRETIAA